MYRFASSFTSREKIVLQKVWRFFSWLLSWIVCLYSKNCMLLRGKLFNIAMFENENPTTYNSWIEMEPKLTSSTLFDWNSSRNISFLKKSSYLLELLEVKCTLYHHYGSVPDKTLIKVYMYICASQKSAADHGLYQRHICCKHFLGESVRCW